MSEMDSVIKEMEAEKREEESERRRSKTGVDYRYTWKFTFSESHPGEDPLSGAGSDKLCEEVGEFNSQKYSSCKG